MSNQPPTLQYATPLVSPPAARPNPFGDTSLVKLLGIFGLLVVIAVVTAILEPNFLREINLTNLLRRIGLFGILGIGVAFVIITGGIDLSIGSVVALVGCFLPWLVITQKWPLGMSILALLALSILLGLGHGLLITKLKLQPFVVTLCGLMVYRGCARGILEDQTQGFGIQLESVRSLLTSHRFFFVPAAFWIMLGVAIVAGIFLNLTIYGRYLLALGRNEQAARYSGIRTDRMIILAYIICSLLAGLGGVLFICDTNSGQPVDFGNVYELYAIAAAVLGGCSLRGGEGSIVGVVIGTAVMQLLYNSILLLGINTRWEFAIIGSVLLAGVIADELVKRIAARRRAAPVGVSCYSPRALAVIGLLITRVSFAVQIEPLNNWAC